MRGIVIGIAALTLAACDSGNVPPPGQEPLRPSNPQVAANEVVLRADGLIAGPEAFYFAAGQNEVEASLTKVLGEPVSRATNEECGAGPMLAVAFEGGLSTHFQDGSLVGWFLRSVSEAEQVSLQGDVQIGTPRSEVEAISGFTSIPDSTLGEEFALGDQIGGFFEEGAVASLYSGTQCFFR